MSKSLEDQLAMLTKNLELHQEALKAAETALNTTMVSLDASVDKDDKKTITKVQRAKVNLNSILKKAKTGENVDKEIRAISKEFEQEK